MARAVKNLQGLARSGPDWKPWIPPPTPTWGRMIAEGIDELADHPQIAFLPSAFMFLTILSLNMMGDRLRQLTDIKSGNS